MNNSYDLPAALLELMSTLENRSHEAVELFGKNEGTTQSAYYAGMMVGYEEARHLLTLMLSEHLAVPASRTQY